MALNNTAMLQLRGGCALGLAGWPLALGLSCGFLLCAQRLRKLRKRFKAAESIISAHMAQTCEVFIGYAGEDKDKVDLLAGYLAKYDTWVDSKNIVLFENNIVTTERRIEEVINSSKVVIFIVTEAWIGKRFPMKELRWALSGKNVGKVLPIFWNVEPERADQLTNTCSKGLQEALRRLFTMPSHVHKNSRSATAHK